MQSYAKKRNIQAKVLTFVELDVLLQRTPIKCVLYSCCKKTFAGPGCRTGSLPFTCPVPPLRQLGFFFVPT